MISLSLYTTKSVIIIAVLLITISCKKEDKVHFKEVTAMQVDSLEETFINIPLEMIFYKNYILMSDFNGDSLVHIFDTTKNKIIRRSAYRGDGPNDFLSPLQLVNLNDSVIFINNRWHYNFGNFQLCDKLEFTISGKRHYTVSTDVDMVFPLDNKRYIASGRFNEGRYALLNNNGQVIQSFGNYPHYMKGENKIPNFPKFMFHQSIFAVNQSRNLLVSVTSHTLEIMDYSSFIPIIKKKMQLSNYKYNFEYGDYWSRSYKDKRIENGVQRISVTDKFIYLLYDPNKDNNKSILALK